MDSDLANTIQHKMQSFSSPFAQVFVLARIICLSLLRLAAFCSGKLQFVMISSKAALIPNFEWQCAL